MSSGGFAALFSRFRGEVAVKAVQKKADVWAAPIEVPEEPLLSSWEGIARQEQLPILAADYIRSFRGDASHPSDWESEIGNCLSGATCGVYCKCCASVCTVCPDCDGTGVVHVPQEIAFLRTAAKRAEMYLHLGDIDVPVDVQTYARNFWGSHCSLARGMDNVGARPRESYWTRCLAMCKLAPTDYFRNRHRHAGFGFPDESFGGEVNYYKLPACECCCKAVENWWERWRRNAMQEETLWWKDYVRPRMGKPRHSIGKAGVAPSSEGYRDFVPKSTMSEWFSYTFACDNFTDEDFVEEEDYFSDAGSELSSFLEEDCEIPFPCSLLEEYEDKSHLPSLSEEDGRELSAACTSLLSSLEEDRRCGMPPPLLEGFGSDSCSTFSLEECEEESCIDEFLSNLESGLQCLLPVMRADQETVEDQMDHLENKQGGNLLSTPEFIETLRKKKREVRGKEFPAATEGKLRRKEKFILSKHDVFLANSIMDRLRKSKIVSSWAGKCATATKITVDLTNSEEVVRCPTRASVSTGKEDLYSQVFTVLNRPQYDSLNKLAEAGWKEAKSVVLNLHIRSYLPQHLNAYAFCVLLWGHSSDAQEAALTGSYVYLGDSEATILQLPLMCSYIGTSLEDHEAYGRSLVLSTVLPNLKGISAGCPIFGITSIEFTEYLPTSHAGITHEKDSWEAMIGSQTCSKQRFIAGFNVVDTIEKGKEDIFSFPNFELQACPRPQAIVRNFEMPASLPRAGSFTIRPIGSFRGAHIPVNRLEIPPVVPARHSSYTNRGKERFGEARGAENHVFIHRVTVPRAYNAGDIFSVIDVLESARMTMSSFYARWFTKGYIDTNFLVKCHLPKASFAGMGLFLVVDGTGELVMKGLETFTVQEMCVQPMHLVSTADESTYEFILDWGRYLGHVPFVGGNGFLAPHIMVVGAATSVLPLSADVSFFIEVFSVGEELAREFAPMSSIEYPLTPNVLEDLDIYMAPRRMQLGTMEGFFFPLSFALPQYSAVGVHRSHGSARLSHFQGVSGDLCGTLYMLGSSLVACKLRASMFGAEQIVASQARNVYVDIMANTYFELQIKDPFFASSVFGDSGAILQFTPLCSPMSPQAIAAPFVVVFHLKGFRPNAPLCRTINYTHRFGWFSVSPGENAGDFGFRIYPVANVIEADDLDLTVYTNSFLQLCQTSCMHFGKVIIHFSWTMSRGDHNLSTLRGLVSILEGFGPVNNHVRGQCSSYNALEGTASIPLEFGTFAGPTPSYAINVLHRNWVYFSTTQPTRISTVYVSLEVLPGFRFYGRKAYSTDQPPVVPPTPDAGA